MGVWLPSMLTMYQEDVFDEMVLLLNRPRLQNTFNDCFLVPYMLYSAGLSVGSSPRRNCVRRLHGVESRYGISGEQDNVDVLRGT